MASAEAQDPPATELDVARAIAAGELPSPQRVGACWLWKLRISGTGWAKRPSLGEITYRPPENFLTAEMVARCAGLPLIVGHPPGGILTSDEFAARSIGTVALPYVQGDELMAICRVYDADANEALSSGGLSTSPSVVFRSIDGNQQVDLPGGGHVLIEGVPSMLDHLAIVPAGVWDKAGPPSGVRADGAVTGESKSMSETMDGAPDPMAAMGAVLEKIAGGLTDALGRLDAMGCKLDSYCSKVDAMAAGQRDPAAPPGSAAMTAADTAGSGRMTLEEERQRNMELADAQSRADKVCIEFGSRADMPMLGESPTAYRRRLLRPFWKFSPEWQGIDLEGINDSKVLDIAETRVFADAVKAAQNAEHLPGDNLHAITRTTDSGHRVTEFRGQGTFIRRMKPGLRRASFRPSAKIAP